MRPTALLPAPLLPRRGRDTAACLALVIAVRGEVDFATVDLSRATFYDQAAIDALTRTVAGARRDGCHISYTTPPHLRRRPNPGAQHSC